MSYTKKVLVMETLDNTVGHKRMASQVIENLSEIAEVTVAELPGWFSTFPDNVRVEEYEVSNQYKIPQVTSLIRSFKHLKEARKLDRINHYDYIFFLSYHTVVFWFVKLWFKDYKNRLYILHHANIDELSLSKIKRFFFKKYAQEVNHLVFEPFIKEFIVKEYKVSDEKVFILPHPQNKYEYSGNGKKYDCLGISSSNDEELIRQFIEKEESEKLFKNNSIFVLLRSKVYEYDDGALKVIKAQFTDDEYYGLYTSASSILLLFPSTFRYRMSGSIVDALSNRKLALMSDIPLFRDYEKRYPNVCRVGLEPETIVDFIKNLKDEETELQSYDWDKFSEDHSNIEIINSLRKAFGIKEN